MKMEREWSPHDAMEAYLHTLHLCKADKYMGMGSRRRRRTRRSEYGSTKRLIKNEVEAEAEAEVEAETEGAELISALAAGSQARLLLEVMVVSSSNRQAAAGVTPLTLALAVAAKQTKGKLIICIVPTDTAHDHHHHHHHHHLHLTIDLIKEQLSFYGLLDNDDDDDGVIEFRVGNPYEQMRDVENIDFAVIDCKFDDDDDDDDVDRDTDSRRGWRLFMSLQHRLHLNPKGAILIANNILLLNGRRPSSTTDMNKKSRSSVTQLVDQVVKGNTGRRVESSVTALPLGSSGRVQVILRIKSAITSPPPTPTKRRRNRFLVTFDS